jgi:cellulose synthase/poly-beta-1,6-N-acetylglucosamine synthase-like glycosyltransferase
MVKNRKVSVCITAFSETEERVKKLLDALSKQNLKPEEIIIIDAKDYNNCSRSEGRNIAIGKARNEIIAITDVGCLPYNDWLEKITNPFKKDNVDVVSGGYKMVAKNNFEKAESVFLGVKQNDMNEEFMPSARSMAFTKTIWKKAGGFPEDLDDTAEDTVFNLNLIEAGAKFVTAKNAVVDWEMTPTIKKFYLKIKNYARGDAQSCIWWHPVKKWRTHNIKVLTIFARYAFGLWLLAIGQYGILGGFIGIYIIWAYKKAGLWGILLQITSDFAAMRGFVYGVLKILETD